MSNTSNIVKFIAPIGLNVESLEPQLRHIVFDTKHLIIWQYGSRKCIDSIKLPRKMKKRLSHDQKREARERFRCKMLNKYGLGHLI